MQDEIKRFEIKKDLIRKRLVKYTRKALQIIPHIDKPRILDIGCGSGIPTIELARLSGGEITALDIDQPALDRLSERLEKAGLAGRVKVMNRSIHDMDFPDSYFDIIWSEGSIFIIGFERGLREWRRFLRPGGFMMVHDDLGNIEGKIRLIYECGYTLLKYFTLGVNTWMAEYYTPLVSLVDETLAKSPDNNGLLKVIQREQREIDMVRKSPEILASVCFIIQKADS